jgi:hypothetical protein
VSASHPRVSGAEFESAHIWLILDQFDGFHQSIDVDSIDFFPHHGASSVKFYVILSPPGPDSSVL